MNISTVALALLVGNSISFYGFPAIAKEDSVTSEKNTTECTDVTYSLTTDDFDNLATSVINNGHSQQYIFTSFSDLDQVNAAYTYFIPQFTATLSRSYNYNPSYTYEPLTEQAVFEGKVAKIYPEYWSNAPSLTSSWNLFDLSQIMKIKSLNKTYEASKFNAGYQIGTNIQAAISAYINYLQSLHNVNSSKLYSKTLQKQLDVTLEMKKAGLKSLIDVLSIQQQLESSKATYYQEISNMKEYKSDLLSMLDSPICNATHVNKTMPLVISKKLVKPLHDFQDVNDYILQNYPQISYIRNLALSSEFSAKEYAFDYLPSISLSANLSSANLNGNITGGSMAPDDQWAIQESNYVMVAATWNLFDGGADYFNMKSSQNLANGYQKALMQTLISIESAYSSLASKSSSLSSQLNYATKSVDTANKSLQLIQIAYAAGYSTYLDLLTSTQNLYTAQRSEVTAKTDVANNFVSSQMYLNYPELPNTHKSLISIIGSQPYK